MRSRGDEARQCSPGSARQAVSDDQGDQHGGHDTNHRVPLKLEGATPEVGLESNVIGVEAYEGDEEWGERAAGASSIRRVAEAEPESNS